MRRALRKSRGENPVGARDLGGAGLLPVSALGPVSAILLMMPVTVFVGSFSVLRFRHQCPFRRAASLCQSDDCVRYAKVGEGQCAIIM